jgi:hypothetical protein
LDWGNSRLIGKWKNNRNYISTSFMEKYFLNKGVVSVSNSVTTTIKQMNQEEKLEGNKRIDIIIKLK